MVEDNAEGDPGRWDMVWRRSHVMRAQAWFEDAEVAGTDVSFGCLK